MPLIVFLLPLYPYNCSHVQSGLCNAKSMGVKKKRPRRNKVAYVYVSTKSNHERLQVELQCLLDVIQVSSTIIFDIEFKLNLI